MPASTAVKLSGSIAAAARSAAARMSGHSSVSRSWTDGNPSAARSAPSAATASSRMFGCVVGAPARRARGAAASVAPSSASARIAATITSSPAFAAGSRSASSGLTADGFLERAEPSRGERRACSAHSSRAVAGARARRADLRRAAARTRPATTPSPAGRFVEHRRGKRVVCLQPHQREQPQLEGLGLRRARPATRRRAASRRPPRSSRTRRPSARSPAPLPWRR